VIRLLRKFLLFYFVLAIFLPVVFAEDITITTYYPSPYGSYRELQSDKYYVGAPMQDTDDLAIYRATSGVDQSEMRVQIGDNTNNGASEVDKFIVGATNNLNGNAWCPRFSVLSTGEVGIGTTNPGTISDYSPMLHVKGATNADDSHWSGRVVASGPTNAVVMGELYTGHKATIGGHNAALAAWSDLLINPGGGNVGIRTTSPGVALDVAGQIRMSGASGGKMVLDVAEVIPVADDVEEGDVVCIDNTVKKYQFAKSKIPDSQLVAGVISSTKKNSKSFPALLVGNYEQKQKDNPNQKYKYLAIAGQIAVNVCLEGGTIKKGDLLTTSSVSGYAMKSQSKQLGTIIGKALEDFDGKDGRKGIIIALLSLM
jgi:hypothetical protein